MALARLLDEGKQLRARIERVGSLETAPWVDIQVVVVELAE